MVDRAQGRLKPRVAVIGGGWAGCAAALALADGGCHVTLLEAGATLGGRARRVRSDGFLLDNGQHLLLGAYQETLQAIERAHGTDSLPITLKPLALVPFSDRQANALRLEARSWPPPFGLLAGLLLARGLSIAERIATVRAFARWRRASFRCGRRTTVADLMDGVPEAAATRLWTPLCLAALNTAPERASGQIFLNVLKAAFDGDADASKLVVTVGDLAALFPDAAMRSLTAQGHDVITGAAARIAGFTPTGPEIVTAQGVHRPIAAVVAVGPHQLARAFTNEIASADADMAHAVAVVNELEWEPIVTVYLGYEQLVSLPPGLVRLDDNPGQWIFDRRDVLERPEGTAPALASLFSVVISARGPHESLDRRALVAAVDEQLKRLRPSWPTLAWSQVITEKRATYSCTPAAFRPVVGRLRAGVYLAGDYTDADLPATLEAAVRTGNAAAAMVVRDIY